MPSRRNSAAREARSAEAAESKAVRRLAIAGVDAHRATRLGVDQGQFADVDELVLARIGDLEGHDRVATGRRG